MGLNRYFVPNLPSAGSVLLPPDESHHALRVRRETVGAHCIAFDGIGNWANCRIAHVSKRDVTLEVDSFLSEPNELPGKLTLAVAMPKGDRQKAVIEKAVELGVHELIPILCFRSVRLPNETASEKWGRTVIEACKQCERNRLMTIVTPCTIESLLQSAMSPELVGPNAELRIFAHPTGDLTRTSNVASLYGPVDQQASRITIAIGPEGGFTDAEVDLARQANWQQLDLGSRILRVETAVCVSTIFASLRLMPQASQLR